MTIEWKDADNVAAQVGEVFMIKMFANLGAGTSVRLGLMGKGVTPNYQVEKNGELRGHFRGTSHKVWSGDAKEFDSNRISDPFAHEDLMAAFLRQYRKPRGTPLAYD